MSPCFTAPPGIAQVYLDLESQTHWWRHYYTEDVTFSHTERVITIHFDFPAGRLEEYKQVVPLLQMPRIDAELRSHTPILLKHGLGWSVRFESRCKPYSDVDEMPEEVLTAMLKQLAWRRRAEDEERRLLALSQFQEARPSIERRLKALQDRESSMEPGAYLLELSNVAFDLFELGGRRSARSVLYNRYLDGLQHLQPDDRIRVGMRLLGVMVDDGQDFEAMQLIEKIAVSIDALLPEDERKRQYAFLRIRALISACAYGEAKAAIESALEWASQTEAGVLNADLAEIELLQGDFGQDEEA